MDVDARLEAMERENERLRDEVTRLNEAMGTMGFCAPMEFRLTVHETRLLGVLLARPLVSKDTAMSALYRDEGKDEPEIKIIDVFICHLRRKVKPFGIKIETVWGRGYRMSDEAKADYRARWSKVVV